jgi:hypothetical protein
MFSNAFHPPACAANPRAAFEIHSVKNIMDFAVFDIGELIPTAGQGTPNDHFIPFRCGHHPSASSDIATP